MTYSILSIIANEVSPSGCSAFTYALGAFQPYTRAPWYQFSEQQVDDFAQNGGTHPAFPFLTGHGGFNQIGPFGWLGLRTDQAALYIDPALPPQIPYVKLRRFYYGGAAITAVMNRTHTRLSRVAGDDTSVHDTYGSSPMPILVGSHSRETYSLTVGQSVVLKNRLYSSQGTIAHNLVQCLPATSPDAHQPGQFPLAALDGAISTTWQPKTPARTSMVVDMSNIDAQPVVGISFNWGLNPPVSADVTLSNSSTFDGPAIIIPIHDIGISDVYDASNVRIRAYSGNTTNVVISASTSHGPVYSGKYARLEIEGTQGPNKDLGATVAEFALIGSQGVDQVDRWTKVDICQRE